MAAGRVSDLIPLWRIYEDGRTFLTRDGDPVAVIRLAGRDFEGLSDEERESHSHHVANLLRTLDRGTRVYHYLSKARTGTLRGEPTHTISAHVAILVEARARSVRQTLFPSKRRALIGAAIDAAVVGLEGQVRLVTSRLEALGPTVLDGAEAFRVFATLVNGPETTAKLLDPHDIDDQLSSEHIDCSLDRLRVGGVTTQVLTMKTPPRRTLALMLAELYRLSGEFTCCLEWHRVDSVAVKKQVEVRRLHSNNYKKKQVKAENKLLSDAADAIALHGHSFGECSLTIAVRGEDAVRLASEAQRVLANHDGAFVRESLVALDTWAAMLPGNHERHQKNGRYRLLLDENVADLACLFGVAAGGPRAITRLRTQQGTEFDFAVHVDGVGHTMILGVPGSGKTTLLHVIADAAKRTEDPRIIVFDLGHGYRDLAARLGGRVSSFYPSLPALNPFAFDPTPEHLMFLQAFCTVLAEGIDGTRLPGPLLAEMYQAIKDLYVLDPEHHRLGAFVWTLPPELRQRLSPWVEGGMYANVFDRKHDDLTIHDTQVFEFDGLEDQPALLQPLLFYVLHRVSAEIKRERMTLCLMDESWRFLSHPMLNEYVKSALKTWRKHNAAMVMASQELKDFAASDLLQTAVESCPTVLMLASERRDRELYTKTFNLNGREWSMLGDLRKGKVFMKRPGLSKVLDFVPVEEGVTV